MAPPTGQATSTDAVAQSRTLLARRKADAAEEVLICLNYVRDATRAQPEEPQAVVAMADEAEAQFERFERLHGEYSDLGLSESEAAQADQDRRELSSMWREALVARCRAKRAAELSDSPPPGGGSTGGGRNCLIKPPRLPVPKFGGNLLEYSQWTRLFRVALESAPSRKSRS